MPSRHRNQAGRNLVTREVTEWDDSKTSQKWKQRANCRDIPVNLFFSNDHRSALRVCKECPVARECLDYCCRFESTVRWRSGVFGMTVPADRNARFGGFNPDNRKAAVAAE